MLNQEYYLPAPHLRKYINCYHSVIAPEAGFFQDQKISCLGRFMINFCYGDEFSTACKNTIHLFKNGIYFVGIHTHPRSFIAKLPGIKTITADIKPEIVAFMLQENLVNLTNTTADFQNFPGYNLLAGLPEALSRIQNDRDKISLLDLAFTRYFQYREVREDSFLKSINAQINRHLANINVWQLGREMTYSERSLRRKINESIGLSPHQYIKTIRSEYALVRLLFEPIASIHDAVYEFGYYDQSHFIADMQRAIGLTPRQVLEASRRGYTESLKKLLYDRSCALFFEKSL